MSPSVLQDQCREVREECRRSIEGKLEDFLESQCERDATLAHHMNSLGDKMSAVDRALRGDIEGEVPGLIHRHQALENQVKDIRRRHKALVVTIVGIITFLGAGAVAMGWNLIERGLLRLALLLSQPVS